MVAPAAPQTPEGSQRPAAAPDVAPPGWKIRVLRSAEEIETIRPAWERLQWHVNADIDFFLTVVATNPATERPHVLALEEGGEVRAIVAGRIDRGRLECRLGYKALYAPPVRTLVTVYGGWMGQTRHPNAARLVDALYESLKRGEADLAQLSGLPPESDPYLYARRRPAWPWRDWLSGQAIHWKMSLPASYEEFLKRLKGKHRNDIRRNERNFEKAFPGGRIRYALVREESEVERLCDDVEMVARQTYQRGLGAGFRDDDQTRRLLRLAARRGWLRAYLIYVDELPVAFEIGTLYGQTFHLHYTGYRQDYRRHEVGTIVFMKMVGDLCQRGIAEVDFGPGDAPYKACYGDAQWREGSVMMFGRNGRGAWLGLARLAMLGLSRAAEALVRRFELTARIKKLWRASLTPASPAEREREERPATPAGDETPVLKHG